MSESATAERTSKLRAAIAEEIGVWLVRRRKSAAKLAQELGWSQSYMARRMVGAQPFDTDDLETIAEALGVGFVDLLPRDRRQATSQYPPEPVVTGTHPHPEHPIIAGSVRLPRQIARPRPAPVSGQQRIILTAPHDLPLSL